MAFIKADRFIRPQATVGRYTHPQPHSGGPRDLSSCYHCDNRLRSHACSTSFARFPLTRFGQDGLGERHAHWTRLPYLVHNKPNPRDLQPGDIARTEKDARACLEEAHRSRPGRASRSGPSAALLGHPALPSALPGMLRRGGLVFRDESGHDGLFILAGVGESDGATFIGGLFGNDGRPARTARRHLAEAGSAASSAWHGDGGRPASPPSEDRAALRTGRWHSCRESHGLVGGLPGLSGGPTDRQLCRGTRPGRRSRCRRR